MSAQERLQKAIETIISSGYQLNSEAFEVLIQNAERTDPVAVICLALERMANMENKPLFIDRDFLETILQQAVSTTPAVADLPQQNFAMEDLPDYSKRAISQQTIVEETFYPYARDITSDLKILEDVTGSLTSNGTLVEYGLYFQDRFKRVERLLRQRMDVKAATPITEALKSPPKTKLKIICMLTEKRDSKNNTILSVEDLHGSAIVLIPQKAPEEVKKKVLMLLPDTVFCAAVIKTRTNLLLAEDIILPEVGGNYHEPKNLSTPFSFDIHVGIIKFNKEAFRRFILA